jgi:hypothetical protein
MEIPMEIPMDLPFTTPMFLKNQHWYSVPHGLKRKAIQELNIHPQQAPDRNVDV